MPDSVSEAQSVVEVVTYEDAQRLVDDAISQSREVMRSDASEMGAAIAADAADGAAARLGEQMQDLASPTVSLVPEQWDYLQTAVKGAGGAGLVGLLLIAMIFGAVLASIVVERWRR